MRSSVKVRFRHIEIETPAMMRVVRPAVSPNRPVETGLTVGCKGVLTKSLFHVAIFYKIEVVFHRSL